MIPRPRFGRNCLTRDPSGVLARDARCRLLIFRSAGDHWQVDLQITPNRRSWLLLTNRKWQLCRLAIWIPSTVSDHKHPSQAGKGFCASRQPGPRTGYCWKSVTTERTELMPSRLFPSARHNCSREADGRSGHHGRAGVQIRLQQPFLIPRRRRGLRRRCARPGRRLCAVPCGIPRGSRPR